jgi:hypothetical protein
VRRGGRETEGGTRWYCDNREVAGGPEELGERVVVEEQETAARASAFAAWSTTQKASGVISLRSAEIRTFTRVMRRGSRDLVRRGEAGAKVAALSSTQPPLPFSLRNHNRKPPKT